MREGSECSLLENRRSKRRREHESSVAVSGNAEKSHVEYGVASAG
jgi:hypothetical protein